jgi:hypothetical protein
MRPGVGRLVAEAAVPPLVLPFYHAGLHQLLRKGELLPLGLGKRIDIMVGPPVGGLPELMAGMRAAGASEREVHLAVAARVGAALEELRREMEQVTATPAAQAPAAAGSQALGGGSGSREAGGGDS